MTTKIRKQIYIELEQSIILKKLSTGSGVSEAEVIRRAIDRYAHSYHIINKNRAAWENERAYIKNLIALGPISGERSWRREDLYDR